MENKNSSLEWKTETGFYVSEGNVSKTNSSLSLKWKIDIHHWNGKQKQGSPST
jgi:hypothetical protein